MAVTYNIKGTTNSSFKVGKSGTGTVYLNTLSADDLSATGNLTVSGNLIVSGTTTTVNSNTIEVKDRFVFEGATADAHETTLIVEDPTADRTVTIPNATTTLVGRDTTDTLTNKTLTAPTITDAASISITNTSTSDSLLLTTTEASSSAGPILTLKRNSASPADADYIGQIKFKGENDADQEVIYAKVSGKIDDASDSSEDGLIEFAVQSGGSNEIVARIKNDGLFLNTGNNIKFEGATADAHELTLAVADPTSDRTITLPDETGIVIVKDSVTGMIQLPVGTTVQRPTPVTGMMRFNSSIKRFEGYNGTDWVPMSPYPNDITTTRDGDEVQIQPTDLGSVT